MKGRLYTILIVAMAFLSLWAAGSRHSILLRTRAEYNLVHAEALENAPPLIVFSSIALGGFTGILADILWIRAARLQTEGEFFELVQLAEWITRLQPRFPQGWVYHAWNLSYNVSVMFQRPEDRWRWVRHGIELLRDGGLRYNPRNPTLHRELGWLFQHKIGQTLDQAHMHYKYAWAMEMSRLFDGRGPDYEALIKIPLDRSELLENDGVAALVEKLRSEGFDPFASDWPEGDRYSQLIEMLHTHPSGEVLHAHMRLRIMSYRYKLIPDLMQQLEAQLGPMDWRLPQAHAAYWAWKGIPYATGFERLQLDRMIFQSMADAFRNGRLHFDPEQDIFIPGPNPDILPYVMQAYEAALSEHDPALILLPYLNFLNQALVTVYTYNRLSDAQMVFDVIQYLFPDQVANRSLDDYAVALFTAQTTELVDYEAHALIEGAFYQSFFWMALDNIDRAEGYDRLARQLWNLYMAPRMDDAEWRDRTALPAIEDIRQNALERVRETIVSHTARERIRQMFEAN